MSDKYQSYEDFLMSAHISKLMSDMGADPRAQFEWKFIRGERSSHWKVKFFDSEFLVSCVPVNTVEMPPKKENKQLYYSELIKIWKS